MLNAIFGNSSQMDLNQLKADYGWLLATKDTKEEFQLGFILIRDFFIFTNLRLILVDKQGISGKKMEVMSIPYTKITRFSVENAGTFDLDSELKIWVHGEAYPIIKKFRKDQNIREIYRILSDNVI